MAVFSISGRAIKTQKFSAVVSPGTTVQIGVPVKTVTLKPVGGDIWIKGVNDSDSDAFPVLSGESVSMDILPPYTNDVSTIAVIFTTSGSTDVYALAGH